MLPHYQVYAIRYAWVDRMARDNFVTLDPHLDIHDGPMPLHYYVWAIIGEHASFVVDTGFNAETARRRNRVHHISPTLGLAALGLQREAVTDVIVTHMHYDHAGNLDLFPNAVYHLQDQEMAFATGRHMCEGFFKKSFEVDNVVHMVRSVFAGRVRFHRGDDEIASGVTLHRVGGHTDGLQAVRVHTARGWVVLASDAAHYYLNLSHRAPFPTVFHIGDTIQGFHLVERLADSPDHIIPGHDPEVMNLYPRLDLPGHEIASLHLPPKTR